jgi:aminopeptidase-like protein
LAVLERCLECIEKNDTYRTTILGEPQLGRRGLYPTLSKRNSAADVKNLMNILAYSDGSHDLLSIAELIGVPVWDLFDLADTLRSHDLLASAEN